MLDVRNFSGSSIPGPGPFDATAVIGDSVSRGYSNPNGVGDAAGNTDSSSIGLVTQFTIVTEPGAYGLFSFGVIVSVARSLYRFRRC